ncbi:MAG: O-antigen ligase family protein [Chthoniobacteraceae bacterium]
MNLVHAGLLAASIVLIQCLTGGTRLVFALPAYALISLSALLSIVSLRSPRVRPSGSCLVVTAIFFAYMLGRSLNSPWDYLWWQDFFEMLACLMVYGLFTCYAPSASARMALVGVLLVLAVGEFFVGLRQFRYGDDWMPFGFIRPPSDLRASGTLISSIHYGGFLEALGALALAVTCWSRWPGWVRFLTGYSALLCYGGVAISGSRGAYLSTLVSLAAFAVLSLVAVRRLRPERLRRVMTIGAIVTAGVLVGGVALMLRSPLLQKRLDLLAQQDFRVMSFILSDGTREGAERPNADVRIYNWRAALDHFCVSPVFGTGAGTHLYYGRLFRRPQIQSDPIHAHSDYLELLAEYGLVGAAGMIAFLFVHLRHGLRRFSHILGTELGDLDYYQPARSDDLALVVGALSAVAAYLAHSIVDFNLHIPGNALTFAFIFAILAAPRADAIAGPGRVETAWRLALPALAIWMAVSGLAKFPGEYWWEKARVALRDRRFTPSIELARRALNYQDRNAELWFHFGEAQRAQAMSTIVQPTRRPLLEGAVAAYRRALGIFPFDEHALVRLGQTLDELGRFVEAKAAYRKAIEHDPQLGVLRAYYAQHLFRVGRYEEAHSEFAEAHRLGTQDLRKIVDQSFIDAPAEPAIPEAIPR